MSTVDFIKNLIKFMERPQLGSDWDDLMNFMRETYSRMGAREQGEVMGVLLHCLLSCDSSHVYWPSILLNNGPREFQVDPLHPGFRKSMEANYER